MGAKKKLVARISKSEPLILKSKPLIFHPLKTCYGNARKMQTKTDCALNSACCCRINAEQPGGKRCLHIAVKGKTAFCTVMHAFVLCVVSIKRKNVSRLLIFV